MESLHLNVTFLISIPNSFYSWVNESNNLAFSLQPSLKYEMILHCNVVHSFLINPLTFHPTEEEDIMKKTSPIELPPNDFA